MMHNTQNIRKTRRVATVVLTAAASLSLLASAQAAPVASAGYSISTFGAAPANATGPDSIAVSGNDVFIGYANNSGKTGGGTSTIAEYNLSGALLNTYSVSGHNDGLKVDPTGNLWAMQNEDGNPNLAIIDPVSGNTLSTFNLKSSNSGGGYDDIVFQNNNVYFSASNAQNDPNTDPAIVKATLNFGVFQFTSVLQGNATAINGITGGQTTLDLTDADSLTTTPGGALLLTDQTANQLITVANPGAANQTVTAIGTSSNGVSLPVDDTIFNTLTGGTLLVSDTSANTVYAIHGPFAGQTVSAAPNDGFVGTLNLGSGVLTPIVTGFGAPKGMGFIPAAVPEAGTQISFGAGALLFLGFFLKRRRQTAV